MLIKSASVVQQGFHTILVKMKNANL